MSHEILYGRLGLESLENMAPKDYLHRQQIKCQCCPHIETSQSIRFAVQLN